METQAVPTVSIIVVNYRTRQMTLDCLRSVISETRKISYEIILVDNASNDGIIEAVRREMPRIHCVPLATNVGFARANNIAGEQAKGRFLLLLNPDTVVLNDAIGRLVEFAVAKPEARIWGGQSLAGDRALDPTSCWRRVTLWSVICRTFGLDTAFPNNSILSSEAYGGWDRLSVREVDIICGCFMLIDRELWDRLSGFDKAFFLYGEEADFCLRALKVGARPAFTPKAEIIHYGGASEQQETEKLVRKLSARAELIKRHLSPATQRAGLLINSLLPFVRAVGYGISAKLSRDKGALARSETWWRVWMRRTTWQFGMSEDAQQASTSKLA
jgi:GT2 family glycosyltransferase